MANGNLGVANDVTDKRQTQGNNASTIATPANYASVAALRTRLAAINAGLYTSAYLDLMTKNDMVYAVRLNDDSAGV